jgi:hypothetical protein
VRVDPPEKALEQQFDDQIHDLGRYWIRVELSTVQPRIRPDEWHADTENALAGFCGSPDDSWSASDLSGFFGAELMLCTSISLHFCFGGPVIESQDMALALAAGKLPVASTIR